jgi:ferredoxin
MTEEVTLRKGGQVVLERKHFQHFIDALAEQGYCVVGPVYDDGTIIYDELESVEEMPIGWTDKQEAGQYRLIERNDQALFGYSISAQAWKKFLNPPRTTLWHVSRVNSHLEVTPNQEEVPNYAFLGVRACELNAIAIQDRVFIEGEFVDPIYKARREKLFIVALNCGQASGTCFCASMETGPEVEGDFDLALTEILRDDEHYFLVNIGSRKGVQVVQQLPYREATDEDIQIAQDIVAETRKNMGRTLNTEDLPELLVQNYENPHWEDVANRCMTCGNCTLVCPTCFCMTVEDYTDLSGDTAERVRLWDSCFTMDFSYIHGGSVRYSSKARYRQWLTHKLATWVEQFGSFGCVGCGRCITWCPVGIDITAEATAIRNSNGQRATSEKESA